MGIGIAELASAPSSQWMALWLGHNWKVCPWRILFVAMPIYFGLLWAFRRFAPVRLPMAGAAAGLTAGLLALAPRYPDAVSLYSLAMGPPC
jgi:hypothetical protein